MNKRILQLAIPFIIGNITVPLLGTVDTALMGHFGKTSDLGAIGLASSIFNFLYWNFAFIKMSTVGLTAQEFGRKDQHKISNLLAQSMFLSFVGAFILILFKNPLLKLCLLVMEGDITVESLVADYYKIRIYAAPATIGIYTLTGWFIGMQNAKAPMFLSILVNILNLGFNFLFVVKFNMKSEGVAWGTLLAQYGGFIAGILILFSKYRKYLRLISLRKVIDWDSLSRFLNVNKDIFIRTFFVIFVLTFYNFISTKEGGVILGVNVIFLQLVFAFSFFLDGFANAAEALVGRFVGEKDVLKLKLVIKYLFYWGIIIALIFTLAYLLGNKWILRVYTSKSEILEAADSFIIWIILLPAFSFVAFIWDGIYLGATSVKVYRNSTLVAALLFFTVYYCLYNGIGNHSLLLAQLIFFGARGIIQTIFYKKAIITKITNQ